MFPDSDGTDIFSAALSVSIEPFAFSFAPRFDFDFCLTALLGLFSEALFPSEISLATEGGGGMSWACRTALKKMTWQLNRPIRIFVLALMLIIFPPEISKVSYLIDLCKGY